MSTKKTTKKPVAKKATAKKAKVSARKPAKAKAKSSAKTQSAAKKKSANAKKPQASTNAQALKALTVLPQIKGAGARRPTPNDPLDGETIILIGNAFSAARELLEGSAANLRPLDRMRLNGVGIKKQGFIERAFDFAVENLQFLPQWLTIEKFRQDYQYFVNVRVLLEACTQLREFIWNLVIQAADVTYTDSLEFYATVREASQRRIDGAETIHRELEAFFRRHRAATDEPTEDELERDIKALLRNKRDGKVVIENVKPKLTGGGRKVIDQKFTDSAQFKESREGDFKE